jgi:methionyl-tRNA formyltransferase
VLAELAMVNLHFSLLPRWRGAAPVERAILAGDTETGVCVMQIEEGLDTGPVFACERVPIGPTTTADDLRATLVDVGTPLLVDTLQHGLATATPQQGEAVYAAKVEPADLELDWTRPPEELARLVRVGGAWTTFRGKRLKVLAATVADGQLRLEVVQPEGKAPMTVTAWRNGAHPAPGELPGV